MNLRLALRSLLKTPLVTGVAILSLALGVGTNAAIFSLFEQMILRSLPVPSPHRLVNFQSPGPKSGSISTNLTGDSASIFSYPMLRDLEEAQTVFTGISGHRTFGANLAYAGDTLSGEGMLVTGSYFEVLGLQPVLGRLFNRDDDRTPGAHSLAVLSHAYWRHRFDADPGILGDKLVVNGQPMTVIGVAPRGFKGTTLGSNPQVFVPLTMRGRMLPGRDDLDNRNSYWVYLFGRLKPGITVEQATAAINVSYRAIIQEVELPLQSSSSDSYLERFAAKEIVLEPGLRGQSVLHGEVRTPLLLLLGVSGFVLLIACANIANLLLVKAIRRSDEFAVRLSLGAQRHHVVRQLLTESSVLAVAGGAVGWAIAQATMKTIASILPPDARLTVDFVLSPPGWVFLAVLTFVMACAGLFPALHSIREDLAGLMRGQLGLSSATSTANRLRSVMVAAQIALAMALLISAGLFTRSLLNVSRVDLGIDVEHLATFGMSPGLNNYPPVEARSLFERVENELRALPGVTAAAASLVPLIAGDNWGSNVSVEGFDADPDTDTHASFNEIGPSYFRTLGIPLLAGREFEPWDDLEAPKVAIVSESFAEKFRLGRDAVGKRMQLGTGSELDIEIVGLVADASYSEVKSVVPPLFYLPYRQDERLGSMNFYVRFPGEPRRLLATLRGVVSRLDPNLPIENPRTMEAQVRENVFLDRMLTTLSASFAILATILAAVGLYGVMAYSVSQRTREIGLRMALGADATRVRRLILRQVAGLTAIGALLGVAIALAVGRAAQSLLYELDGHDPGVFAAAVLALAAVAVGAGLLPAERAAQIDPIEALRYE